MHFETKDGKDEGSVVLGGLALPEVEGKVELGGWRSSMVCWGSTRSIAEMRVRQAGPFNPLYQHTLSHKRYGSGKIYNSSLDI